MLIQAQSMNVQHLRFLVETIKAGSISAAARRLGRSASTLSSGIATLEDDLGVQILDRSGHKPIPTEAGHRLLPSIVRALGECDYVRAAAESVEEGNERSVRLICDATAPFRPLMELVEGLPEQNFTTQFRFDIGFGQAEAEVLAQRADLGLITRMRDPSDEVSSVTVSHCKWRYYCHRDHPLLLFAPHITNQDLEHFVCIMLDDVNEASLAMRSWGRSIVQVNSPLTLLQLLAANKGFAIMPEYFESFLPGLPLVSFTPAELPTDLIFPCCLIWHRQTNPGPVASKIIERAWQRSAAN